MGTKISLLALCFALFISLQSRPMWAAKKSYVVFLGKHSHVSEPSALDLKRVTDYHHELLGSCMRSKKKAKEAIFYSYTRYFNGFAATLEDEELFELSKHPKVASIFPNRRGKLLTTRSWEFLGLERNGVIPFDSLWLKAKFGEDIIIGTLDTGVWPESESFNDEGIGPIPSKWKGYCNTRNGVKCNRKLIGARYFNKGFEAALGQPLNSSYKTARDYNGHGTHTLSTAAGLFVPNVDFLGSSYGTAKGGSPSARVASYKVCWPGCNSADVLAGYEAAIHDGVDIISVSLEFPIEQYFNDATAIGAFHAVENGILVVAAAGNSGSKGPGTVKNLAPWILTVGACTINRDFPSNVILGNNKQYKGLSLYTNTLPRRMYHPLVHSVDAKAANASASNAKFCSIGSLDPMKVKGKIIYCTHNERRDIEKSLVVAQAGGVGTILANQLKSAGLTAEEHFVPTSVVSAADGLSVLSYIYSTKLPVALITGATEVGTVAAPIMAGFSSFGPNLITPEILKPDITAPGVQILAAYSEASAPSTNFPLDQRRVKYNIVSGTSMACPHVSGIAGLLKSIHPDWSPAAIKSAIMTTARTRSNVRQPIANASLLEANPFNYGAGYILPNRAMDPGLVYDLSTKDYLNFLCSIGYNSTQLLLFVDKPYKCPSSDYSLLDFNYPSIVIPNLSGKVTLSRILSNVGTPNLYKVHIKEPNGISVKVEPTSLKFNKLHEQKMFKVILKAKKSSKSGQYVFGGLTWSDGEHHVRSPIVVEKADRPI